MDVLLAPGGFDVEAGGAAWMHLVTEAISSGLLAWAVAAALFLCVLPAFLVVRRRRFRCPETQRDVEVDFQERGLPGRRQPIAVLSCSAFDPPRRVLCDRACLRRGDWALAEPARKA